MQETLCAIWEIGARSDSTPFRVFLVSPEKSGGSPPILSKAPRSAGDIETTFRPIFRTCSVKIPSRGRIHPRATSHIYAHHASLLYTKTLKIAILFKKFFLRANDDFYRIFQFVFVYFAHTHFSPFFECTCYINKMKKTARNPRFRYSLFTYVLYNKVEYAKDAEAPPWRPRHNTQRQVFPWIVPA